MGSTPASRTTLKALPVQITIHLTDIGVIRAFETAHKGETVEGLPSRGPLAVLACSRRTATAGRRIRRHHSRDGLAITRYHSEAVVFRSANDSGKTPRGL